MHAGDTGAHDALAIIRREKGREKGRKGERERNKIMTPIDQTHTHTHTHIHTQVACRHTPLRHNSVLIGH